MQHDNITLGISFCKDGEPTKVVQDGVTYYPVPNHSKSKKDKIIDLWKIHDVTRDEILWPYYEEKFKKVIEDFKPDIIQIFGSELYQQLAARVTGNIPTVLHIQGLLSLYVHIFLPPSISKWQYYMSGKGLRGKLHKYCILHIGIEVSIVKRQFSRLYLMSWDVQNGISKLWQF